MSVFVIAEAGVNHNGIARAGARAGGRRRRGRRRRGQVPDVPRRPRWPRATPARRPTRNAPPATGRSCNARAARAGRGRPSVAGGPRRGTGDRVHVRALRPRGLDLLVRLGVLRLKLGSGELTNGPLLEAAARTGLPLILSTGMATLVEVTGRAPRARRRRGRRDGAPLHDRYPAPPEEVNLRAMATMADALGVPVGYSDHTIGQTRHPGRGRAGRHHDREALHHRSLAPRTGSSRVARAGRACSLVATVRTVEAALGDGVKRPSQSELPNLAVARKSLVAAMPIAAGEPFSATNVAVKRPGTGISPMRRAQLFSRTASRAYAADELLDTAELPEADR